MSTFCTLHDAANEKVSVSLNYACCPDISQRRIFFLKHGIVAVLESTQRQATVMLAIYTLIVNIDHSSFSSNTTKDKLCRFLLYRMRCVRVYRRVIIKHFGSKSSVFCCF